MSLIPNLTHRSIDVELMDEPESDPEQMAETLRQLSTINRLVTPCHRLLKKHFIAKMQSDPSRIWTLLDVGAGGGDFAIWISRQCERLNLKSHVTCLDHDARVVEFARRNCRDFSNIEIVQADVLSLGTRGQSWDLVFSNHFLHHLTNEQLAATFPVIQRVCDQTYLLTDLWRSYSSYYGFSLLAAVCFRKSFCFHDGRISIRKGFKRSELQQFIDSAGLTAEAVVRFQFPGHWALIGNRC